MTTHRPRSLLGRVHALFQGMMSLWVRERERRNPRAVYEQAIAERTQQYRDLKGAVAGILYMRNRLEGEIQEQREELARTLDEIRRAVRRGDDDAALTLVAHKQSLSESLERAQREISEIRSEAEEAKANLVRFRDEISRLEHEKLRSLATLANARARRRVQHALAGLSVEADMRALDAVRDHVARVAMEGQLESELEGEGLAGRVRQIRKEARLDAARRELDELKRELTPASLPAPAPVVVPVAHTPS